MLQSNLTSLCKALAFILAEYKSKLEDNLIKMQREKDLTGFLFYLLGKIKIFPIFNFIILCFTSKSFCNFMIQLFYFFIIFIFLFYFFIIFYLIILYFYYFLFHFFCHLSASLFISMNIEKKIKFQIISMYT